MEIEQLVARGAWSRARRAVRAALGTSPDDHWLWSRLALTYYEQRRYHEALQHELHALALQPTCPLALWGFAGTREMLGEPAEAERIYRGLLRRGVARLSAGRCGEGVRWARGLVADCWYRLGEVAARQGRRDEAARAYRRHLALRRGGVSIYDARAVRAKVKTAESGGAGTRRPSRPKP